MATKVRTIYIELRASAERLQAELREAGGSLDKVGQSGQAAGRQIAAGSSAASDASKRLAKDVGEVSLALLGAGKAAIAYSGSASTGAINTDGLINAYRGLRIALSPTPFTVAAVAAGLLTEETVKLTLARAKLIEQQALIAAISRTPITTVQTLQAVADVSGGNATTLQGLSSTLSSRGTTNQRSVQSGLATLGVKGSLEDPETLEKIARGFDGIADPAKRAAAAVSIFGADRAEEALRELNLSFIDGSAAVRNYGLVLDEVSRTQIFQFRQDMLRLQQAVTDFSQLRTWWESFKTGSEIVAASAEDMAKRGAKAFDDFIARTTHLRGALVAPQAPPLDPNGFGLSQGQQQGQVAGDLFAEAQGAAARRAATLSGLEAQQAEAQARADAAFQKLQDNSKKLQINPNDSTLLTGEQRFGLANQQQAASALAASLSDLIAIRESSEKIINQQRVTDAVGANYEAKRNAEVENQTASEVSRTGAEPTAIRARLTAEYDARHATVVAEQLKSLKDQIALENQQAAAQTFGSAVTERATLELKLHRIALENDADSAKRLIAAERELFAARKLNADQQKLATLNQETRDIRTVTAAVPAGPAAIHQAELENNLAELKRNGASAETVAAARDKDASEQAKHRLEELTEITAKTELLKKLAEAIPKGSAAVSQVNQENQDAELRRSGKADLIDPQKKLDAAQKSHDSAVQAKTDAEAEAAAQVRITEIKGKSEGETKEVQVQGQRLALERSYALAVAHTAAQQIEFATRTASIDEQARQAKIAGLQKEFDEANQYSDPAEEIRAAQIAGDIARLKAESANADYEAQTRVLGILQEQNHALQARKEIAAALIEFSRIDFGTVQQDFARAAVQTPQAIGNSLASGIIDSPQRGESKLTEIGKSIEDALKNVGKNLLGDLITQAIEKLIAELIGQAALNALLASTQTANTVAVTANTAAVVALTAAQAVSAGASVAGGAASAAGGVAGAAAGIAGGAASAATGGIIGPVIGGVISGVISATATLIGDFKIIRAINATTAAVNGLPSALRGQSLGQSEASGLTADSKGNPQPVAPSRGPGFSQGSLLGFVASIFGGGAKAVDVNIVSISPLSPLKGLFNLLGFADGGTPPVGVPAIGGEVGPELAVPLGGGPVRVIGANGPQIFTPRERMAIIPSHRIGDYLGGSPLKGYAEGAGLALLPELAGLGDSPVANYTATSGPSADQIDASQSNINIGGRHTFNIYESDNPRETARKVAGFLKTQNPNGSPFSSGRRR